MPCAGYRLAAGILRWVSGRKPPANLSAGGTGSGPAGTGTGLVGPAAGFRNVFEIPVAVLVLVVAEDFGRMLGPAGAVAALQVGGGAVFVATPADPFRMSGVQGEFLDHLHKARNGWPGTAGNPSLPGCRAGVQRAGCSVSRLIMALMAFICGLCLSA